LACNQRPSKKPRRCPQKIETAHSGDGLPAIEQKAKIGDAQTFLATKQKVEDVDAQIGICSIKQRLAMYMTHCEP